MTKFQTPFNENIQKQSTNNWGLPQPKSFDLILQKKWPINMYHILVQIQV